MDALPVGPPPRIGYVVAHTYHSADGSTLALRLGRHLRTASITSITRLGDGFLATDDRYFEGSYGVFRVAADGTVDPALGRPGHQPGFGSVASDPRLSPDGATVWWVTFAAPESLVSEPTLLHRGDVASGNVTSFDVRIRTTIRTSVVGVLDEDVVLLRADLLGEGRTLLWARPAGIRPHPAGGAAFISADSRLAATRLGRDGRVGAVRDLASGEIVWRERGLAPYSFSPSGSLLLARTRDGVEVRDARSGAVVRILEHVGRWASAEGAWEDDHHLLVPVVWARRAAIVRVEVRSGEWALAVDWTPLEGTRQVAFETTY